VSSLETAESRLEDAGISPLLKSKWKALRDELSSFDAAVIAYSGGVDSSFLSYVGSRVLAGRMIAVTIRSPLDPPEMADFAADFAARHAFQHDQIMLDPLANPLFRSNPADRCYHCKTVILNTLWDYARQNHYRVVLEGQNADDQGDYRPGRKAVEETGTFSPLARSGLAKAEIRWLARALDLSIWDRPSSPCLATRFPYGMEITEKGLNQVALAEAYLHAKGFEIVRVRYHQDLARIEVDPCQIQALLELRDDLVKYFKQIGFLYIALDLQGYRLGSMNEGLPL
jgi:pyridinium-3,5-biscarboxylic acid mononucleotide sulfurtransferase